MKTEFHRAVFEAADTLGGMSAADWSRLRRITKLASLAALELLVGSLTWLVNVIGF
jgi:hypothetical protein